MCKYCKGNYDGYYQTLDKNGHVCIFDKPHEKILNINWHGKKMKININYCPMCGKWLKWITKQELQVCKFKEYKILEKEAK